MGCHSLAGPPLSPEIHPLPPAWGSPPGWRWGLTDSPALPGHAGSRDRMQRKCEPRASLPGKVQPSSGRAWWACPQGLGRRQKETWRRENVASGSPCRPGVDTFFWGQGGTCGHLWCGVRWMRRASTVGRTRGLCPKGRGEPQRSWEEGGRGREEMGWGVTDPRPGSGVRAGWSSRHTPRGRPGGL